MTYVITQSCCNDASCILECPVDCIRPTPGDPEFLSAEMLYIDPDSCIDCGACQDACPVSAIYPEDDVPPNLRHFTEFNAGYFLRHPLEPSVHVTDRPAKPAQDRDVLRVAIIGSGPSAAYLAEDLLERGNVKVDVLDKLPTPWGLLRYGVAPDHLTTKDLASIFERPFKSSAFEYHLNVEVGRDIAIDELLASHHAVVVATGAADPVPWDVPGAELAGVHPATDFVAWYNGHPDHAGATFDLSTERAVVIGNGNVALDVARILLLDPDQLRSSDIAEHARQALCDSKVREVVIVGRRGALQAAYTTPEFHALTTMSGVEVVLDPEESAVDPASRTFLDSTDASYADILKAELATSAARAEATGAARRVVFRYLSEPTRVVGTGKVEAVEFRRNELVEEAGQLRARPSEQDGYTETAGLVLTAIGYRGRPLSGVPFDDARGAIPHQGGRVLTAPDKPAPGLYTVGWAKRGAKGGIGAGRPDAQETADRIVEDFNHGILNSTDQPLSELLADKSLDVVSTDGWAAINAYELASGAESNRPRLKLVRASDMLRVAAER